MNKIVIFVKRHPVISWLIPFSLCGFFEGVSEQMNWIDLYVIAHDLSVGYFCLSLLIGIVVLQSHS